MAVVIRYPLSDSVVVATHFPQPSIDCSLARWNAGIADATVFGKSALAPDRSDSYTFTVALEK
jgi:hypothetical protein